MEQIFNTILSVAVTILMGIFAVFLLILEDNKKELWERIKKDK